MKISCLFLVGAFSTVFSLPLSDRQILENTAILSELEQSGITAEQLLEQLRSLAARKHACPTTAETVNPDLRRHFLTNMTVVCNDGSRAG